MTNFFMLLQKIYAFIFYAIEASDFLSECSLAIFHVGKHMQVQLTSYFWLQ